MTQIVVEENYLTIKGHTGYEEYGKDIVCAALSSLICGASNIWKDSKFVNIEIDKKNTTFKFTFKPDSKIKIESNFLINLLKILAENYPKNIEYKENIKS